MPETRLPDGALMAQKDAPVGGQAVLEGVMMRGVSTWAVAVRKPAPEGAPDDALGEIGVQSFPLVSWTKRHRALRWPIIRGVVALVESMKIGFTALGISANEQLEEEEEPISSGMWVGTVVAALALAIGLFFVVPVGLTSLFKDKLGSAFLFWLVEGVLRTTIFLGYLWLLSRLEDLRRVFEYHGAEHKTISCFEAGLPLTPENAQRFSRLHPRCGTSFLLIVMIVAIFIFAPLGLPAWYLLVALAHPRRAADRGPLVRGHQVGGQEPPQALGADAHLARHAAAEADHARARPLPARRRDRRHGGGAGGRGPAQRVRRGHGGHGGRRLSSRGP